MLDGFGVLHRQRIYALAPSKVAEDCMFLHLIEEVEHLSNVHLVVDRLLNHGS
jgi:hypothetical protein